MAINTDESKQQGKYGTVKRSVLRNLLFSMLAFGLCVGLIFPPFARIVLDTERAYSPAFISMCVLAGLLVGVFKSTLTIGAGPGHFYLKSNKNR